AQDRPIDGEAAARQDHDTIRLAKLLDGKFYEISVPTHPHATREKIEQSPNRSSAPRDREAFQHLGDEDEGRDYERREYFADDERSYERNRHRQFHRHPSIANVVDRLLEDRI